MKYILLKNGTIVQPEKVIKGDMLISGKRIVLIKPEIALPNPDVLIIDVEDKYILPGLIHFRSPFLKVDESNQASTIYIALSHGSTFLMDTLKISQTADYKTTIAGTIDKSKPIISDFSLHLDASTCSQLTTEALNHCYIHEGVSSFYLKWKHVHKIISGEFNSIFEYIASNQLLLVLSTATIKKSTLISNPTFFSVYLQTLKEAVAHIKSFGCPVLVSDLVSIEELEVVFDNFNEGDAVFAAVSPPDSAKNIPGAFTAEQFTSLASNENIVLDPPLLTPPIKREQFIENSSSYSFIHQLTKGKRITKNSLKLLCNMYATRPSKIFGSYPQKGALLAGSDADLIVWSPVNEEGTNMRGANTSLLRADIDSLIINGRLIRGNDQVSPGQLNGSYIFRNAIYETLSGVLK